MVRLDDVLAQQRFKHQLEIWIPSFVPDFEFLLKRTGAQVMGSFPLFCLAPLWQFWEKPGDLDIFLCPRLTSRMHRDLLAFETLLTSKCGFQRVASPNYDPFLDYRFQDGLPPSMHVYTYTKNYGEDSLQVQVIFWTGVPTSPTWHLRIMWEFDLSCCSVSNDSESFHVTSDNHSPTTQRATIRRLNPSTQQRIVKYHCRGFKFVVRTLPFQNALVRSDPSVESVISLCKLLLSWH